MVLKKATKCWNEERENILIVYKLKQSEADPCMFTKEKSKKTIHLILYVDNKLIRSKDENEVNEVIYYLKKSHPIRAFIIGQLHKSSPFLVISFDYRISSLYNRLAPQLNISFSYFFQLLKIRFKTGYITFFQKKKKSTFQCLNYFIGADYVQLQYVNLSWSPTIENNRFHNRPVLQLTTSSIIIYK